MVIFNSFLYVYQAGYIIYDIHLLQFCPIWLGNLTILSGSFLHEP